jgi:uncharacterized protein (DUF302 family)
MRHLLLMLLLLLSSAARAQDDELITIQSAHSAPVTVQRLQEAIVADGFTIFATIDYAAQAAELGVKIPARTTIAFGWMPGWTHPLILRPTIAIELPFRVLVWQDSEGVWMTRDTARYIVRYIHRHEAHVNEGLLREQDAKIAAMIENLTR